MNIAEGKGDAEGILIEGDEIFYAFEIFDFIGIKDFIALAVNLIWFAFFEIFDFMQPKARRFHAEGKSYYAMKSSISKAFSSMGIV